jgi:hypothetical protein
MSADSPSQTADYLTGLAPDRAGEPVTIGQIQTWYSQDSGIVHCSALRQVIKLMIDQNIRTEFDNDSYLDALILSEIMLDRCTQTVRMLTGGCDKFLQTLELSFLKAFDRLKTNPNGKIRIIVLSNAVPEFLKTAAEKFGPTLEIAAAEVKPGAQVEHFLVCDSMMARIEKPHQTISEETPVNAIQAKVSFNEPSRARFYETRFDAIWDMLKPKVKASTSTVPA